MITNNEHRQPCLCGKYHCGFTLVEILVAMFIMAVVISTIYTAYTGTFRIVDETEYQAEIYRMARITFERMQEDLESVYMPQYPEAFGSNEGIDQADEFSGEDNEINGRSADALYFISRAHLAFSENEQAYATTEIGYKVGETDEEKGLVLYRTDVPVGIVTSEESTSGPVLCEKLASVNFTYYDSDGEVYESWDSQAEGFNNKPPRMVSILLEFVNRSDPETPFAFITSVALPMSRE